MKGYVSLFGGVNTRKAKYFKHAVAIYKELGFQVEIYEATGMKCLIPTQYKRNVDKAYHRLMEQNQEELKKIPKIIHVYSGGLYSGLELNERFKHDTFIMEASPFSPYNISLFRSIIKAKLMLSLPINTLEYAMNCLGIPTEKYQKDVFETYERQLLQLPNVFIINGEKDEYLDKEFVKEFIYNLQLNGITTIYFGFEEGTHYKIAKTDIDLYREIIVGVCK